MTHFRACLVAAVCLLPSLGQANTPPSVQMLSPANGSTHLAPASVTLTAIASDREGAIVQVAFHAGTTFIGFGAPSFSSGSYAFTWNNIPAGSYSLTATASDNQGAATTSAPVSIVVTDPSPPPIAPSVYYIYADHLNTPRVITDGANKVVWRWDSDPFGADAANEDPDGDGAKFRYNLRFPGQYYDRETGLHYNYFRDYEPGTGRYVQADPIGIDGGMNLYAYVEGNPINYIDPEGLLLTALHSLQRGMSTQQATEASQVGNAGAVTALAIAGTAATATAAGRAAKMCYGAVEKNGSSRKSVGEFGSF